MWDKVLGYDYELISHLDQEKYKFFVSKIILKRLKEQKEARAKYDQLDRTFIENHTTLDF